MRKLLLYILAALCASITVAQVRRGSQQSRPGQGERKIYLLHANTLSFNKSVDEERQVLRGDVQFRQDSIYMYCDSAYFYESTNSMQAFSNVRMVQGDTLSMLCDSMSYDGNAMFAQLFDNVVLVHNSTVLRTDYLTYDRQNAIAHYPYHGTIVDPDNHLVSQLGWYYPEVKEAVFKDDVVLHSYDFSKMAERPEYPDVNSRDYKPRAILYSDTLRYMFTTADAFMLGASRIVNDTATVYSTLGTYNTNTLKSHLYERSSIVSKGRFATADSLFYDGALGVGDGWGDIVMVDSLQKMKLTGEYLHYIDSPQSALVTGRALAMEFSGKDTLYLHADTLYAYTVIRYDSTAYTVRDTVQVQEVRIDTLWNAPDTLWNALDTVHIAALDTVKIDTIRIDETISYTCFYDTLRYMDAYYGVRYYREDLQGVCDSLHYSARDSLATFVGNPVMWNESYQITGDTIFTWLNKQNSIERAEIHNQSFLVQEKDTFTVHEVGPRKQVTDIPSRAYDQIKGKDLVCYFDSAHIRQLDMSGNVQVVFYPVESDGGMIGLNQVIGNYLSVWFKDQKMDKIKIWPSPIGSLTPLQLVKQDIMTLDGFRWMDYLRPKFPMDVFRRIEMSEEDKVESVPLFNVEELNGYQ